jgi:predicted nucleotidyltransferase
MQTENSYIEQLTESLKTINPYLVLLFGSYAYGTLSQDSDIDLLVVTNDDFMPKSFDEKIEISLKVKKHLLNINKLVALDLIVYTRPMYKKFIELRSSFSREILSKGIILYESNHSTMA